MQIDEPKHPRARERGVFWAYLSKLITAMGGRLLLALALMVFLSLIEGIGVLMLVPLLQIAGVDVHEGTLGRIAGLVSNGFEALGIPPTLLMVLSIYVLITSIHALLNRWETSVNLAIHHEFVVRMRKRLYAAIGRANWLFFAKSKASDFTHVLTNEVERVGGATYQFLHLVATIIVTCVYVFFALQLSAIMTGLVLVCGGGLMLLLKSKTRISRMAGEDTSEEMNKLYAAIGEHIGAMKIVKSHGTEDRHVQIFANLAERVHRTYIQAVRNQTEVKYWFDIGSVLVLSLIVFVSLEILSVTTGELLLLLFLFARIVPKFATIQKGYQNFVNLLPALISVVDMEARCEAVAEPVCKRAGDVQLQDNIRLARVTFAYDNAPVIQDLSLSIHAGKTTAIVGPSGAGKTTVADLVIGLIVAEKGRVLVDGNPLEIEKMHAWRNRIGYVAQETFLFHDTVRANLLWSNSRASEEEIWEGLRLTAADGFVSNLPEGLDTVVGDRGVRLSGGERQRLALARALLRRPTLLILDEATSNLDSENEMYIRHAVEALHGAMTILVISHRLSTVRNADVIYVLEEGRLVESASWDSLLARENGRLRALCQAQGIQGV